MGQLFYGLFGRVGRFPQIKQINSSYSSMEFRRGSLIRPYKKDRSTLQWKNATAPIPRASDVPNVTSIKVIGKPDNEETIQFPPFHQFPYCRVAPFKLLLRNAHIDSYPPLPG
jgi:hypothetical protein